MADRVGQQLGNYRLLRLLGQGGQASVHLGEHIYLKSQAALKVRHTVLTDEERAVFLQEAQTLVRLTHPHIVRVLDFAVQDGMPFLVMEYAPHGTLRQRHPKGTRLPLDVILPYVQQVASALQYTHDQRLIHRDVKPENILLSSHDQVLLSDFGLVMRMTHTLSSGSTEPMEPSLAGTTPYLAPEQLQGKARTASDQYALGVVVYEWLCGRPPFRGPFLEVAVQHVSVPPPSLREQVPDLSPAIEEVVLRALAKEPELRFARVQDFATALEHASQEALAPRFTPVLALEHRIEAEPRRPSFPALKTLDTQPNNLPVQPTAFIGREQEVAAVATLLCREDVHLVTLTGPGGTGKTRLGLQVAAALSEVFHDGVFFVNLAPLSDPEFVLPAIAQVLNVKEMGDQSLLDLLKAFLREKHMLLLLDNFEQVVKAALPVAELLAACPKLKIMVTSRVVLHVRAEHEFAVPPLELPDPKRLPDLVALSQYEAVALFIQRAQAVKSDFQMTNANAPAIAEICARLDGLPLAIELAAARIKLLPPQALLAQLEHRLPVLTSGPQDAPVRQQTLRNTLAWSYDLLNSWEQRLLRQLSVFVGGCTLQAAEAVCRALGDGVGTGPASVLDGVASLIDKSLLYQTEREGEEPRFGMLEMTREYGQEMLAMCEETEAARQAHAAYYLALVEQAAHAWEGPQHAVWLGRLERDHDNLRSAMQWSLEQEEDGDRLERAFRFGAALRSFWQVRGYFREGRTFLEGVLAQSEGSLPSWRSKALNDAVLLAVSQGDHDGGEALCQENLLLCRELGDSSAVARTLYLLGWLAWLQGKLATAHSRLSESLALFREVGDKGGSLVSLFWVGVVVTYQGEYTRARAVFEHTLAMQRELANKRGIAWSLFHLALVRFLSQSDLTTVRPLLEEAGALFREIGDTWGIAECSWLLGWLTLQQGDAVTAHTLLEQSLTLFREIDNRRGIARSLTHLGAVTAVRQDWVRARMLYEESLTEAQEAGDKVEIASCLEGVAGVIAAGGASLAHVLWAAQLWGVAEVLRETMGAPLPPVERAAYEERVAAARSSIGKRIFSAYWAQGRTMTPEQALAAQGKAAMPSRRSTESVLISSKNAAANLAGLTAREVEVLRWVALGLTDAQVAEQLVISPRTVTSHLSSIYNKLGVTSRAAATRFAVDHQLV